MENVLIHLLVLVIIGAIVFWLIDKMALPDPFRWIVILIACLIGIIILLRMVSPFYRIGFNALQLVGFA